MRAHRWARLARRIERMGISGFSLRIGPKEKDHTMVVLFIFGPVFILSFWKNSHSWGGGFYVLYNEAIANHLLVRELDLAMWSDLPNDGRTKFGTSMRYDFGHTLGQKLGLLHCSSKLRARANKSSPYSRFGNSIRRSIDRNYFRKRCDYAPIG